MFLLFDRNGTIFIGCTKEKRNACCSMANTHTQIIHKQRFSGDSGDSIHLILDKRVIYWKKIIFNN